MSCPAHRAAIAAALLALPVAAFAQARPTLSVGRVTSVESCTMYLNTQGRSASVGTWFWSVSAASWRTWWTKECSNQFPQLREALEAALASAGPLGVRASGGRYRVNASLSPANGGGGGPAPADPDANAEWSIARNLMRAHMTVSVVDPAGRVVFGRLISKTIETGSRIRTDAIETSASDSGDALYSQFANEISAAAARAIAFHFDPLRVIDGDGSRITLNYGAPLLPLGGIVRVVLPGGTVARYSIIAPGADGTAIATRDGDVTTGAPSPGTIATFAESDDPAANSRRYERVPLP